MGKITKFIATSLVQITWKTKIGSNMLQKKPWTDCGWTAFPDPYDLILERKRKKWSNNYLWRCFRTEVPLLPVGLFSFNTNLRPRFKAKFATWKTNNKHKPLFGKNLSPYVNICCYSSFSNALSLMKVKYTRSCTSSLMFPLTCPARRKRVCISLLKATKVAYMTMANLIGWHIEVYEAWGVSWYTTRDIAKLLKRLT